MPKVKAMFTTKDTRNASSQLNRTVQGTLTLVPSAKRWQFTTTVPLHGKTMTFHFNGANLESKAPFKGASKDSPAPPSSKSCSPMPATRVSLPRPPASVSPGSLKPSVSHALDVLEQFSGDSEELGVTELSKRLKLHKNNVFRLLATLESRGYIEQNRTTENYRLGIRCLQLGQAYVGNMGVVTQALFCGRVKGSQAYLRVHFLMLV